MNIVTEKFFMVIKTLKDERQIWKKGFFTLRTTTFINIS